jgi:hypothetical protein
MGKSRQMQHRHRGECEACRKVMLPPPTAACSSRTTGLPQQCSRALRGARLGARLDRPTSPSLRQSVRRARRHLSNAFQAGTVHVPGVQQHSLSNFGRQQLTAAWRPNRFRKFPGACVSLSDGGLRRRGAW